MKKDIYILILITIVICLIGWYFFIRKDPPPIQTVSYEYVTDSIYVDRPYEVRVPYEVKTPPITVTEYLVDSVAIKDLRLKISEAKIIIESLNENIIIQGDYLKQYPNNPKLIAFYLNRDTLNLGLLLISGLIVEERWPIDLNAWVYSWNYESNLTRHPTQPPPVETQDLIQLFIGGGATFGYKSSPHISLRGEMGRKNLRVFSDVNFMITQPDYSNLRLGVEYKIYGKSRIRKR